MATDVLPPDEQNDRHKEVPVPSTFERSHAQFRNAYTQFLNYRSGTDASENAFVHVQEVVSQTVKTVLEAIKHYQKKIQRLQKEKDFGEAQASAKKLSRCYDDILSIRLAEAELSAQSNLTKTAVHLKNAQSLETATSSTDYR